MSTLPAGGQERRGSLPAWLVSLIPHSRPPTTTFVGTSLPSISPYSHPPGYRALPMSALCLSYADTVTWGLGHPVSPLGYPSFARTQPAPRLFLQKKRMT